MCLLPYNDFLQNYLFQKILQELYQCQMDGIVIRTNILLVLIWVQTVNKGYQQMTKVTLARNLPLKAISYIRRNRTPNRKRAQIGFYFSGFNSRISAKTTGNFIYTCTYTTMCVVYNLEITVRLFYKYKTANFCGTKRKRL